MKKLMEFFKDETVLAVAMVLAAGSALIVPPSGAYMGYIDWNTLLLLFGLMAVMAGLQGLGIFSRIGGGLLGRLGTLRQMAWALVFLPFFFSMVITNDVALITFVPFALIMLELAGRSDLAVPVVVLQTVAANLGSMLTPMGNPQNLYLYAQCGMGLGQFLALTAPYVAAAGAALFCAVLLLPEGRLEHKPAAQPPMDRRQLGSTAVYLALFAACLAAVAGVIPPLWAALLVLAAVLILDRPVLGRVDYGLLGTFVAFFIFIGNMGQIGAFRDFLSGILQGREQLVAVLASQVISNVPAALLLSGFTDNWPALIVGTNLGGLGTLIASMASLISYKQICKAFPERKGKYFALFTGANLALLAALLVLAAIL